MRQCKEDNLKIADTIIKHRILLGSAGYPSLQVLKESIAASGTQVVTLSLRRARIQDDRQQDFWQTLKSLPVHILPNTAGCRSAQEAVALAHVARSFFNHNWIKLEVIGDEDTLQPNPFELVKAAEILNKEGFVVLPYTTEDLVVCERLLNVGCSILMPWAAPIGSGRGVMNPYLLKILRARFPDVCMIIDAGLGVPSDAAQVMEMGFDAVLLNTAVSQADDPIIMAKAFACAVEAGRLGYEAGLMKPRVLAAASTPVIGTPIWHHNDHHDEALI